MAFPLSSLSMLNCVCLVWAHVRVNNEPLYIVCVYRLSVPGSIARLIIIASATPNAYLPWMAPHVEQTRLATNSVK